MKGNPTQSPTVLIFMGVAGSGKTTVATLFAKTAGADFYEGDEFHPPENVAKMHGGIPLTDADREPWLDTLHQLIAVALAANRLTVLTCSALKSKYQSVLAAGDPRVKFVHLTGSRALLEERLNNRRGHFMSPALLESQLAILEPPPDALVFSCEKSPERIVEELLNRLGKIGAD